MYDSILAQKNAEIAAQRAVIAELTAERDELAIDEGWRVPVAKHTRRQIDRLPPGRVGVAVGDVANLKQLNSATGYQPRTDELFHPAFHVRAEDTLILGKRDGGDQFILVATDIRAAVARIDAELALAPMTNDERRRYVQGVCVKKYGPWLGRVVYRLGLHNVAPHPCIDWQVVDDVDVRDIHAAASAAERKLFGDKAARLTFGVLVKGRAQC